MANQKMPNIEFDGQLYSLRAFCNKFGLKYQSVYNKYKRGMDIVDAIQVCIKDPNAWQGIKAKNR